MSFPFPSSSTPAPGSSHDQQPRLPFRTYNGQSIDDLQADLRDEVPNSYDAAAAQQRLQAIETARATATEQDINQHAMSLGLPAQDHYPTRTLPNPAKRKRYSLDDVTFQLSKVRVDKSGTTRINIIPPEDEEEQDGNIGPSQANLEWASHISSDLPFDIQTSLRRTLSARAVSQRKASDHITRSLSATLPEQLPKPAFDLISAIGSTIEILVAVGTHLRPRDILTLYAVSRVCHATLDTHMQSSVVTWSQATCHVAAAIFPHHFYVGAVVPDPIGRPADPAYHDIYARLTATAHLPGRLWGPFSQTRNVPSLVWLQMVHARSTRVRDIIACLARQGHRLPPESDATLLKLWLILELPTNADRCTVVRTKRYFSRFDLYRATLFLVKLTMRFNDPLYGPDHGVLAELMLGQRGLTPLWKLLRGKAYTTLREVVHAKMRYDVRPSAEEREAGLPVLGVPVDEMGAGHLEGWGLGREHLLRPDELIVREAARRGLELDDWFENMAVYGHIDISKAVDLVPAVEELYMSDEELEDGLPDEECARRDVLVWRGGGNVPFREGEWTPKLAKKGRWEELSEEEKKAIIEHDKDEMLKSLVWEEETKLAFESESSTSETMEGDDEDQEMEGEEQQEEDDDEDDEEDPRVRELKAKLKALREVPEEDEEEDEEEDDAEDDEEDEDDEDDPKVRELEAKLKAIREEGRLRQLRKEQEFGEVEGTKPEKKKGLFDDDSVLGRCDDDDSSDDISVFSEPSPDSQGRVGSLNMPELQSRNCSSINSMPVMTPPPERSPDLVGIHDGPEMDAMDLDEEQMDTTLLPSSMTGTPVQCALPQRADSSDEESYYGDDEDELDDEERQRLADELDEELRAQADQDYTEEDLDYNWDEWKVAYDLAARANEDDMEDVEARHYRRQY